MLGLASRWGVKGLDEYVAQLARDFLAAAADAAKPEAARIDAARQLIDLRKTDPQAARDVIALVTAKTPPELASGLIAAVARSDSPEVGPALVDAMGPMTPAARKASVLALLGKTDWTDCAGRRDRERARCRCPCLSLSQSQALAAHPDSPIAERAKALLARGGGLPDPDREKVIQALAPIVLKGGDASRGKEIFKTRVRQVPHALGRGGQGRPGPHRHGRASQERADRPHPRPEPIGRGELPPVHRLDHRRPHPERPAGGRDEDLGRPARRRGEEADDPPRGHRGARLVEEVAHARGVREIGPAGGAGRPPAVPRAEGEVPAARPPQGRDGDHDQGVPFGPGASGSGGWSSRTGARRSSTACRSRWSTRRATACRTPSCCSGPIGTIPPKMPRSVEPARQRDGQGDPPPERRGRLRDSRPAARGPSR